MKNSIVAVTKFFAGFFQENRPESFGRGITLVVTMFVLGWDTSYVAHSHALPDAGTLTAQTLFMTAFYFGGKGLGKIGSSKPDEPTPPQPQ